MVTVNSTVVGMSGHQYYLEKEIGSGGEGNVFTVRGSHLVAKIYKKPIPGQEQKLLYMVYHHVPNLCDAAGKRIVTLAWPSDVLYDASGEFIGYIMPMIDTGLEIFEICRGCTSPKAKKMFPDYSWKLNVTVAQNLAIAVDYLHSQSCIIGDMNCKNLLVNADGTISILDADSFDITDPQTNTHFKCGAGTEDYLAPELQGRNLRAESARFSVYTDYFALAIHIFQLLMNNYHPFNCRQTTVVKNSSNTNPRMQQIGLGKTPFINRYPDVDIPLGAPIVTEVVPYYIRHNFVQTFNYTEQTVQHCIANRTTARKWAEDLSHLLWECNSPQGLVRCGDHYYLSSIGQCGLCNAHRRYEASRQAKLSGSANTAPKVAPTVQKPAPQKSQPQPAPNPPSGTASTAPAARKNTKVPTFLYEFVRVCNWLLVVFLVYKTFTALDEPDIASNLIITGMLALGTLRMDYCRNNGLDHSVCPFSGALITFLYKIWVFVENYVFISLIPAPIVCLIVLSGNRTLAAEAVPIILFFLPISLNRIFFLLRANEA